VSIVGACSSGGSPEDASTADAQALDAQAADTATEDTARADLSQPETSQECPLGERFCSGRCVRLDADGTNCGQCGLRCADGMRCISARCMRIEGFDAGTDSGPADAGSDATAGPMGEILARDQMGAGSIALDATHVYWTNNTAGTVMRMPKAGGAPETLVRVTTMPTETNGLVVRDGLVFYLVRNAIWSVPVGGGTPTLLGTAGGSTMSWAQLVVSSSRIVVGAIGSIWSLPRTGGTGRPVPLSCNQCGAQGMAGDEMRVYWTGYGNARNEVLRYGDTLEPVSVSGGGIGLALDATHVYVGTNFDPAVRRFARGVRSTSEVVVAGGGHYGQYLSLDDAYVYWSNPLSEHHPPRAQGRRRSAASGRARASRPHRRRRHARLLGGQHQPLGRARPEVPGDVGHPGIPPRRRLG
jgi:hypothetical protein